jgi:anti-sigma-K factor RskA
VARELTPAELDELLAAYAIDAVDAEERAQLDAYLERSPDAAREIAELQETTALLAFTGPDEAPDTLWDRIENALGAEPPRLVMPLDAAAHRSPRRRRGMAAKVAIGIAAASAVAAGVTAVVVSDEMARQEQRLDRVAGSVANDGMHRAAEAAAADPRSRTVRLVAGRGSGSATVIAMPDGAAFLMARDMERLGPDRTYQLWAITGDPDGPKVVSAGVLGRSLDLAAFRAPDGATGFMVTDEATPGVVTTAAEPVLEGHFA